MSNQKKTRQNKKEYSFVNNIWLTGYYKHKKFVGRTLIINNVESIMIIDEASNFATVDFKDSNINDIYKLSVNVKSNYRDSVNVIKNLSSIETIQNN